MMMSHGLRVLAVLAFLPVAGVLAAPAAADMPPAAAKMVKSRNVPADLLKGWEDEHKVPGALRDAALKEGELRIVGSWSDKEFRAFATAFRERYPAIKVTYARGTRYDRALKPLLAWKSGAPTVDVAISIGGAYQQMREAGALADLRGLPNFDKLPPQFRDDEGLWAGQKRNHRCLAYNTNLVKAADLPKRWDDIVAGKRWAGGKLGLNNFPHSWLLPVWAKQGDAWGEDFTRKLFALKPQIRKEGQNATVALVVAGEFEAVIMASAFRVKQMRDKGAPVAWHCPEPVPVGPSQIAAFKGTKNEHASKLFINWFLSKEGQIGQFYASYEEPVHGELDRREFLIFPDEVMGKPEALRSDSVVDETTRRVVNYWNRMWVAGGGKAATGDD